MISKIETSKEPAFSIVGIAVRTINKNSQAQTDIGNLWGRFMGSNLQSQIVSRLSDDLYSVYFDYETDHTGYYTALLGCKVAQHSPIPEGFEQIEIPETSYHIYSLSGEIPAAVGEAWAEIWELAADRAFTFDYDRYINASQFSEVKIYVAILP